MTKNTIFRDGIELKIINSNFQVLKTLFNIGRCKKIVFHVKINAIKKYVHNNRSYNAERDKRKLWTYWCTLTTYVSLETVFSL